jgi:nucleotide-binding universal stress UspA family protein
MYGKILVPIDGSETSKRGLTEACRLAKEQGAKLRCLFVIDEHYLTANYMGFMYLPDLIDKLRENGKEILDEASEQGRKIGVQVESIMRERNPSCCRRGFRGVGPPACSSPAISAPMGRCDAPHRPLT